MEEKKYEFKDGKLYVNAEIDPNKDGEYLLKLKLEINLAEIPDEVMDAIKIFKK